MVKAGMFTRHFCVVEEEVGEHIADESVVVAGASGGIGQVY
jgi:NADPH-dependent curcumin reductase CurA